MPTELARNALATCLAAIAIAGVQPLAAQDADAPPSLEDLIPDSAVSDPEAWAQQGTDAPTEIAVDDSASDLRAETAVSEIPGMSVAWPEDVVFEPLEPLDMALEHP